MENNINGNKIKNIVKNALKKQFIIIAKFWADAYRCNKDKNRFFISNSKY